MLLTALLLLAPATPPADVHVVGPGGFATIADALTIASDGDVVLVESGSYPGFTVAGKEVSVVADLGASVEVKGTVAVHGLPAGRTVTLQGLVIRGAVGDVAVRATANDGALWIEGCELGPTPFGSGAHVALQAVECGSVVVRRSKLQGRFGGSFFGIPGGDAAIVRESAASFFACEIRGGEGGWAGDIEGSCSHAAGEDGGDGLVVENAAVRVHATVLAGGRGGIGDYCPDASPTLCGDGGDGGAGLVVAGATPVELLDVELAGGPAGAPGDFLCLYGSEGPPTLVLPGAPPLVVHDGPARGLALASPLREGAGAQATASGAPGDLLAVFAAFAPEQAALPGLFGDLLLAPAPILLGAGVAPGGELVLSGPVPELGAPGLVLRAQTVALTASGGFALGEAATLVLLDAAL